MPVTCSDAGIEPRAFERLDDVAMLIRRLEIAGCVEAHEHGGDLEQRVGRAIEAAGLDVDDHGQEAAEARRDRRQRRFVDGRCRLRSWLTRRAVFASSSAPRVVRVSSSTVAARRSP